MTDFYPVLEQLLLMGVLIALGFYLNRAGKIKQAAENGIAELTGCRKWNSRAHNRYSLSCFDFYEYS